MRKKKINGECKKRFDYKGHYASSQQDEIEKLSDMFRKSKEPPRIYNVKILVIKTNDYRNTMAHQIKNAFPDRVISTICPNKFNITTFYRTRKNDNSLIKEIKAIRDRKKRSKSQIASELDNINGIGEKTKTELLKNLKSIKRIREAKLEDLEKIVGKSNATLIFEYFHAEKV